MYLPRAFAETDPAALDALFARDAFVTLVTVREGVPAVSHLPVLYRRQEGQQVELRGHWARPNPQARHDGLALAIVHGPHAYVSPAWYPDKEAQARVPTWNYAVAHVHGRLETFEDTDSLAELVDALSVVHETAAGGDWRFEPEREDHRIQLRGIIGFRLAVERVELKFKLNQNHPPANRRVVAERLAAQPREGDREIAALMRARTAPEPPQGD
jgi:transcriptional regulator